MLEQFLQDLASSRRLCTCKVKVVTPVRPPLMPLIAAKSPGICRLGRA